MSEGQVVQCVHCNGKGKCNCKECNPKEYKWLWGCGELVICRVCGGKGNIWIGPERVTIL